MPKHKGDPYRLDAANVAAHFWRFVDKSAGKNACWPWTRSRTGPNGAYGKFAWEWIQRAHVAAFYFATGQRHLVIRHTCDNPICCNPKHLVAGTQDDNMQDMAQRNRTSSPLTTEQVRRILLETDKSGPTLARELGVTRTTINRIRSGGAWKYHDARG